jgi:hypothetical protein
MPLTHVKRWKIIFNFEVSVKKKRKILKSYIELNYINYIIESTNVLNHTQDGAELVDRLTLTVEKESP